MIPETLSTFGPALASLAIIALLMSCAAGRRGLFDRLAWGIFAVGGALTGGYLLGLGEPLGWLFITAGFAIGAHRVRHSYGPHAESPKAPKSQDPLIAIFKQLTERARAVERLLRSCEKGARNEPITTAPLREVLEKTLSEVGDTIQRWKTVSAGPAPRRGELEARLRSCERLGELTDDERCKEELELTMEHQQKTL